MMEHRFVVLSPCRRRCMYRFSQRSGNRSTSPGCREPGKSPAVPLAWPRRWLPTCPLRRTGSCCGSSWISAGTYQLGSTNYPRARAAYRGIGHDNGPAINRCERRSS